MPIHLLCDHDAFGGHLIRYNILINIERGAYVRVAHQHATTLIEDSTAKAGGSRVNVDLVGTSLRSITAEFADEIQQGSYASEAICSRFARQQASASSAGQARSMGRAAAARPYSRYGIGRCSPTGRKVALYSVASVERQLSIPG
jgi:hypothetical protein